MSAALPALSLVQEPDQAAALIDPTRRDLLARLREPGSAAGLAREIGLPRQRINYHLKELERAGLVRCVGEQRKGNCIERLMQVTAQAFVLNPGLLGSLGPAPAAADDRLSAATLVSAAARTIQSVAALERKAGAEGKRFATLTLEGEVRFANAEARAAFAAELTDAIARIIARYHDDRAPRGRAFRLVVGTHPVVAVAEHATGEDHA
jgi:DNA-binding transcriptional ArsR family regulator